MSSTPGVRHKFKLSKLSDKSLAYDNCVYLNPEDLQLLGIKSGDKILIDEQQVFMCKSDPKLKQSDLGTSGLVWKALHLNPKSAIGTVVMVEAWNNRNTKIAQTVSIVVDTYTKAETLVKYDELEDYVRKNFKNQVFCKDQRFILRWTKYDTTYWLSLLIATIYEQEDDLENKSDDLDKENKKKRRRKRQKAIKFGAVDDETTISLMSSNNPFMKLTGNATTGTGGIALNMFDAEQMGIGGLDSQFGVIFRRAFSSRLYPADIVKQLGIKHVKGMLLYGPPGTGKTLIARSIGSMLTENEPKVINGPGLFIYIFSINITYN